MEPMLQNMIPQRPKSVLPIRPEGPDRSWRKRALILFALVVGLFVLGHLAIRFVVWPQIEKSKPTLEKLMSARLGADISIDELKVSWTGIRPNFEIQGLRFNGPEKTKPLLFIEKISGELSWDSLYHLAPYFHDLNFDGAQIYAQRNNKGVISIAGIPIHGNSGDYSAENWLFSQNNIDVSNATIFWQDSENKKLKTSIDIQSFHLNNGIRNHSSEITVTTPWHTSPVKFQADFHHRLGTQAGNWHDWVGDFSWDFVGFNLTQIFKDFTIPLYALEGNLSSKGHLSLDGGAPDGGEMSMVADQLKVQLSKEDGPIQFGHLEGNFTQESDRGLLSVSAKTLAWRDIDSPNNVTLENLSPMTFRWRPPEPGGEIKEFGFSSPKILVKDASLFARNLPLSKKVRQWIKVANPDGELQNVNMHWAEKKSALSALPITANWFSSNQLDFDVSAKLIDLSFTGINSSIPSVSHLNGVLSANEDAGSFTLTESPLEVIANNLLVDPNIRLDKAEGKISWEKKKGNWAITAKKLNLSNSEITTTLDLMYVIGGPKQNDQMSLDMSFPKANIATAYRYLPVGIDDETKKYLSKAFSAGTITDGNLHIKGDPDQAPFAKGVPGELSLTLPISDVSFKPVPGLLPTQGTWPELKNISGQINMRESALSVDIAQANYQKVLISQVHAEIPSVSAKQIILSLNVLAQGSASEMLDYLYASPIGKQQPSLEKNLTVTGQTSLNLGLKIPFSGNSNTQVDAKIDLMDNRAQWGNLPPLEKLQGKIRVTEMNPEFENITAKFIGGDLQITSASSSANNTAFSINGDMSSKFIKAYLAEIKAPEVNALINSINGSVQYEGLLNFNKAGSETKLNFDLRNWSSNAPAPLKKLAGTPMLGQLTLHTYANNKGNTNRLDWSGKFGDQYFTEGALGYDNEFRHSYGIGTAATLAPQGLGLNLQVNELDLDTWQEFLKPRKAEVSKESQAQENFLDIPVQVNAQVKKLTLLKRTWPEVNFTVGNKNHVWRSRITSPQISGQAFWHEASSENPNGLIRGRIAHLKIPDVDPDLKPSEIPGLQKIPSKATTTNANKSTLSPNSIPSIDLVIDDLSWTKAELGQVKVLTKTHLNLLTIESIQINNPQGSTTVSGQWAGSSQNQAEHNTLNIDMNIKDAGQIVSHWTNQKTIEGGQGKINGKLEWDGSPFNTDYGTLSGKLNLDLQKGRLLEVNTSAAKILDVLSLQSLFRFATLDLQGSLGNIVTKGTPFKSISSSFDINNGIAKANPFTMELDQARVAISGEINIPNETQDLRVTIFPSIDATAGSLAAFVINPIVGLGALVGQYLITNQMNRNFQTDYLVQGSWSDPEVIPLDQKGQPLDPKILENIRSKGLLIEQSKPSPSNSDQQTTPTSPTFNPS